MMFITFVKFQIEMFLQVQKHDNL